MMKLYLIQSRILKKSLKKYTICMLYTAFSFKSFFLTASLLLWIKPVFLHTFVRSKTIKEKHILFKKLTTNDRQRISDQTQNQRSASLSLTLSLRLFFFFVSFAFCLYREKKGIVHPKRKRQLIKDRGKKLHKLRFFQAALDAFQANSFCNAFYWFSSEKYLCLAFSKIN